MRESRTPCNAAAFHRTTTLSLALVWPSTPSGQIRTARVSKHRKYMGRLDVNVDGRGILATIGILPPAILDHRIYANHLFSPRIDSAPAGRVSVLAHRGRYFTRPSVRRGLSVLREENAAAFGAELREVGVRLRRVGFEVEAVPGFLRRGGRDGNRCRALEEVAAEFVRHVFESEDAPGHSAPFDFHRVDNGAEDPQRVGRVKTVRDRKNVKHADIVHLQLRGPFVNVHLSATNGVRSTPED